MADTSGDPPEDCSCKVGAVAAEFELEGIHDELERRWDEDTSVRELTDMFNRRVLREAFRRAGRLSIDGEIENAYRVLTDDDAAAGSRERAREQLRQDGVPIEDVEDRLVAHQTLYRHLADCLGVTYEREQQSDSERIEAWRERLLALQNRTERVTEGGIEQLRDSGAIDAGDVDVLVDVNVLCNECGQFATLETFLEAGGCECGG